MTILIAPDKFKGSLDTFALCDAMSGGVRNADKSIHVISLPLADGGDGFAKVMAHYSDCTPISVATVNAIGNPMHASYEWDANNKTAIIELAAASGIALLQKEDHLPLQTSTYGTGLMVMDALNKGAQKILLGLGGSATNDGGTGILSALGYRILDKENNELEPCGASLGLIETIISPEIPVTAAFTIACDVQNPLLGETGAAHMYAAQKGATPADTKSLEKGMEHFVSVLEKHTNISIKEIPGSGAAGGTAAGLILLPNCNLQKGTDIVMQYSSFFHHLSKADLVLTGEGRFDAQTLQGKVVYGVAQACKSQHIPCIAICGEVDADEEIIKACGLTKAVSISDEGEDSFRKAREWVREKVNEVVRSYIKR